MLITELFELPLASLFNDQQNTDSQERFVALQIKVSYKHSVWAIDFFSDYHFDSWCRKSIGWNMQTTAWAYAMVTTDALITVAKYSDQNATISQLRKQD